ncbi:hypothetical protein BDR26DRAFT_849853, partial [Obelidium mucronatum]
MEYTMFMSDSLSHVHFKSEPLEFDEFHQDALLLNAEIESNSESIYSGLSRSSSVHTEGPFFEYPDNVFQQALNITDFQPLIQQSKWAPIDMSFNIDTELNKLEQDMAMLGYTVEPPVQSDIISSENVESWNNYKVDMLMGIALGCVGGEKVHLEDQFKAGCLMLETDGRLSQYNDILQKTQAKIELKIHALKINTEKQDAHAEIVAAINANVGILM